MRTVARFAVRYRWLVIGLWLAGVVACQVLASAAGGASYKESFRLPDTETQTVFTLLQGHGLSSQNARPGTVVLHSLNGPFTGAPAGLAEVAAKVCATGNVISVTSPWQALRCGSAPSANSAGGTLLSADRTLALVTVNFPTGNSSEKAAPIVYRTVQSLAGPELQVEVTGDAFQSVNAGKGIPPEAIGFLAALIILAFVFRALFPTVLPLVSAGAALGSGLGLVSLLTHAMDVASFAPQMTILIVLGVGVDYALFIVTRHRRNVLAGMPVRESIVSAVATAGRAVFFAGLIVCIAIMGLWALRASFLYGVAVAVSVGVLLTMVASLTLLPALLAFIGLRILPRRVRAAIREGTYTPATGRSRWAAWSALVARRPLPMSLAAAAVLLVLAVPFLSMRLGHADQGNDPAGTTTRRGYDLVSTHFGAGYNSVLELVVSGPDAAKPAYLRSVGEALAAVPNVDPGTVRGFPAGADIAILTFKSVSAPQAEATTDLVTGLRNSVLPPLYRGTPDHIYVFGQTATYVDFANVLAAKMPYFFAAVVGLSFLLLMVAFRSLLIPATAALMNLLAAGASFGIVVAVFQWGWASELLGIGTGGPIDAFAPVLFFAVLFGLSMDYQVFLISRMHEQWMHSRSNRDAVITGQTETGGIITAAGLIMIAVFGGFLLGDQRIIKLFGLGLASAVFLDAFVIRTVLVPALMHVLGNANWYYPRWLARATPHVSVEADGGVTDDPELATVS